MKIQESKQTKRIKPLWLICISCFIGMALITAFFEKLVLSPVFAPLGSSAILLFGAPDAPFSRPKNLVGGHIFSALTGVVICRILGVNLYTVALVVALSLMVMLITGTVHPPAGATAILGLTTSQGSYYWVLMPVGAGAGLMLIIFFIYGRLMALTKS
ncbi:MAG TPA: HPP family protein [Firmicutes bacterium]|nr:HPP family protein [Bacillota bacterium]